MMSGTKRSGFKCPSECDDTARLVLLRYAAVVSGSIQRRGDTLAFDLDLSEFPEGDAQCVERVILTELERSVSLHCVPDLQLVDYRDAGRR